MSLSTLDSETYSIYMPDKNMIQLDMTYEKLLGFLLGYTLFYPPGLPFDMRVYDEMGPVDPYIVVSNDRNHILNIYSNEEVITDVQMILEKLLEDKEPLQYSTVVRGPYSYALVQFEEQVFLDGFKEFLNITGNEGEGEVGQMFKIEMREDDDDGVGEDTEQGNGDNAAIDIKDAPDDILNTLNDQTHQLE